MPKNAYVPVPAGDWVPLFDADAPKATFQNVGDGALRIAATPDATAPTDDREGVVYAPGMGERAVALADLFPGVTSPVRLWAYAHVSACGAFVSHA